MHLFLAGMMLFSYENFVVLFGLVREAFAAYCTFDSDHSVSSEAWQCPANQGQIQGCAANK